MRSKILRVIAFVMAYAALSVAAADFSGLAGASQTGESLLDLIKKGESQSSGGTSSTIALGVAAGYIHAVRDSNLYNRWNAIAVFKPQLATAQPGTKEAMAELFFCEPAQMSNGQIMAITKNYLEAHPERWNEGAFNLVEDAFKKTYPCKTGDLFR